MDANRGPPSSSLLPELWCIIISLLGPRSLLRCSRVCRAWREWALSESNWERHTKRVIDKLVIGNYRSYWQHGSAWKTFASLFVCPTPLEESHRWWRNEIRTQSLFRLPAHGNWTASLSFIPVIGSAFAIEYHVSLAYINKQGVFQRFEIDVRSNYGDTKTPLDVRHLPGGVTCYFNRGVYPECHQRYHSVVLDTDYDDDLRDERFWLTVMVLDL